MPRARAIAFIVLGSRGIVFTPLPVVSNQNQESAFRIFRDVVRSLIWMFTNWTGVKNPICV